MIFSKTAAYSIRILNLLTLSENKVVSVKKLHESLDLPFKYITKLMTSLSKMGFVKAIRGREGGFLLAKDPKSVTIFEIVSAIDGIGDNEVCTLLFEECAHDKPCPIHPFIHDIKKEFKRRLKATTLYDMAFNQPELNPAPETDHAAVINS